MIDEAFGYGQQGFPGQSFAGWFMLSCWCFVCSFCCYFFCVLDVEEET